VTSLSLVTAPARLPVTLAEVRAHMVTDDQDVETDALIDQLITAATDHLGGADGVLGRALITQTWDWRLDCWPSDGVLRVPLPPLQSVTSITYSDSDGVDTVLASTEYTVDTWSRQGRIVPAYDRVWPTVRHHQDAIRVRYVAGYGAYWSAVPEPLRVAIAQLVTHWYEHREPGVVGVSYAPLPMHVDRLIAPYRIEAF